MKPIRFPKLLLPILLILLFALVGATRAAAKNADYAEPVERVQIIEDQIANVGDIQTYLLLNLAAGDELFINVNATSGNLDPVVALLSQQQMEDWVVGSFADAVQQAIDENRDPLAVTAEFAAAHFLAWDDDSGPGFSAALTYTIPENDSYYLIVVGLPFSESFGEYKLTAGLNIPLPANGYVSSKGEPFLIPVQTKGEENQAVQKVTDTLGERAPTQKKYRLLPLNTNDQLYIYVETLEGDLIPQVVLYAYGSKPIRSANIGGNNQHAALEYTFPEKAQGYLIEVSAKPGTSGTYALYIGKNDPAVLTGNAEVYGAPLLRQPIVASVGVKLQQIAGIDQKAENYSAVASTQITWNDPALAFRPDECECESKVYTANEFINYATQAGIVWPAFTYLNQQNNRWIQSDFVIVQPNGDARYFERFTTTFQAPDFDFRKFPFDNQSFFIRIDSLYASEFVTFTPSDFTGIGTQLGEEEWYITDHDVTIVTEPGSTGAKTASFIFRFYARRHLAFYIYRIILPLALIITVAWITFFLEDYGKRVDATTANLLLFIAFNFTIAGDLPRLGYLTYMDMLLAGAFTLSVLVVAYNVALKRWETKKKPVDWLFTMDKYMLWLYPLIYALTFGSITWYFFLQ